MRSLLPHREPAPGAVVQRLIKALMCRVRLFCARRRPSAHFDLAAASRASRRIPTRRTNSREENLRLNFGLGSTGSENAAMAKFSVNLMLIWPSRPPLKPPTSCEPRHSGPLDSRSTTSPGALSRVPWYGGLRNTGCFRQKFPWSVLTTLGV